MAYLQLFLVLFIGIIGLILITQAIAKMRNKHWIRTMISGSFACLFIALAALSLLVSTNLYTYHRLTSERAIAEINLHQVGEQKYRVSVFFPEQKENRDFELNGDEWQIDARILKWKYPVIWLGLDSHYQLDRISGRYRNIQQEKTAPRSVYSLRRSLKLDIWPLIREYQEYLPWIDALYGSATYLPMYDGARFIVSISQTGLIARPINEQGENSLSSWY